MVNVCHSFVVRAGENVNGEGEITVCVLVLLLVPRPIFRLVVLTSTTYAPVLGRLSQYVVLYSMPTKTLAAGTWISTDMMKSCQVLAKSKRDRATLPVVARRLPAYLYVDCS